MVYWTIRVHNEKAVNKLKFKYPLSIDIEHTKALIMKRTFMINHITREVAFIVHCWELNWHQSNDANDILNSRILHIARLTQWEFISVMFEYNKRKISREFFLLFLLCGLLGLHATSHQPGQRPEQIWRKSQTSRKPLKKHLSGSSGNGASFCIINVSMKCVLVCNFYSL